MTDTLLTWLLNQAPVAVVMGIGLYYFARRDKRKDEEAQEHHKEQKQIIEKVTAALVNNTNALTNLIEIIKKSSKD